MKHSNILKTTLLLLTIVGGVSTAWADAVSIPQDLGSYINWEEQATKTAGNGSPESDDKTQLGSTNGSTTYTITLSNATVQNYLMTFASGASGLTAQVSFTLDGGNGYSVKKEFDISNTGSWTPTEFHAAEFENVPTGDLTLTFKVESTTGSYAGNYGKLIFNSAAQCPWPSSSVLNLQYGTFNKAKWNSDGVINYIKAAGSSIDNLIAYNSSEGLNDFNFSISYLKQNSIVGITITDVETGTVEANQSISITSDGDKTIHLGNKLTVGWKKIRFDFSDDDTSNSDEHLFNFQTVTLPAATYNGLPVMSSSTTYLDLSQWPTSGYPRYQTANQNLGYIYHGNTANFYVYNENETAYYNLAAGITTNVSDANLVVTVIDVVTGAKEVDAETFDVATGSAFAQQVFKLSTPISAGLKCIQFEFTKDDTSTNPWLYNIKNITFYKRSLNDSYDYTPVAATDIDVVLTRSITAGNWSTICLPFAMTNAQLKAAFGDDVKVAELTNGDNTMLNFSTVTETIANKPYAIKVTSNFTSATISGVTIVEATPTQTAGDWQFVGTYGKASIAENDYYFKNNQLYKAGTGTHSIKPFRAYLQYTGSGTAPAPQLNFPDMDGETTGIDDVRSKMSDVRSVIYDLQGRKLSNGQMQKGLYIVNGRKVVIK